MDPVASTEKQASQKDCKEPPYSMAERKHSGTISFLSICIFTISCNIICASAEDGFIANYSRRIRYTVPKNLPAKTTVLDLSQNQISEIRISDFRSLPKLHTLILSHNLIRVLNLSVFQYNEDLEYLDLSHNNLQTLSGLPLTGLKHLDVSYNNDINMTMCPDSGIMWKLEYLGLSARNIQKSDFCVLAHLQLETLFLGLEDLLEYHSGVLPIFNVKNLQIALPHKRSFPILLDLDLTVTESLELSNIQSDQVFHLIKFLSKLNKNGRLLNLTLTSIKLTWEDILNIFSFVWRSTIRYLNIYYMTVLEFGDEIFSNIDTSLKALTIEHTQLATMTFNQSLVYRTLSEMNISALTISDSGILFMHCPSKPSRFQYLGFSNNTLTDSVFQGCNNLPLVETLILQRNYLKDLTKVSLMTSRMKRLKYLDVSHNFLQHEGENKCHWAENMIKLNLSSNMLSESVFRCLPVNIQILDLQQNHISRIPKEMLNLNNLEELNLAFNKLTTFPGCASFSRLLFLNIENNSVLSQSAEFFESCQYIQRLKGGNNPFKCSCELRQFVNFGKQGSVELVGWPDSYMCKEPEYVKGTLLTNFHISELVCNVPLLVAVVLIITVILGVAVLILCIRFDIPWYLKMIWQWTQVKRRNWKSHPEDHLNTLQFHAFVSYSEHDSEWVKNVLIPNLEKEDGSIRICQHERNFVAGKSIVENIIDCIEKSYKSIFVLSPNFVQSEWCHYELYFAHHQLFSEDGYGLILILLESIPTYVIPARYHKLKALMVKRTYLEWPKEKSKQGLFWANLRAAIQIKLLSDEDKL
ncbi:toll-like receptor 6 isoform X2 [Sceloporus undulatus]|uniref:toll-like receptor 6 isoform X2 n=1 Tax=Sceloporus undulatus TaxID=8520 RepID=UPI001C4B029F|nr:toll-like receptor 6 isoform X2 [Sceloporus undulatus]